MGIDFYYLPASPPCRSVMMVAELLGIKLNKKYVDLFAGEHLKPDYLKMNPQHTVPTIDDDGFYLGESRAILQYLVNKYSPNHPIYPEDPQERAAIDRMLYFNIGTLFKAEREYRRPQWFEGKPADPEKYEIFEKALKIFEELLGKTTYAAANHITIADYDIIAGLSFTEFLDVDLSGFPRVKTWMQKLKKEIPNYHEINDVPIQQLKEFLIAHRKAA